MQVLSRTVRDTLKFGRRISAYLEKGDIICLSGDLGAGKTVLTKGIASGLGIKRNAVVSPTFVLIREYNGGRFPLYHFDLYRLKSPSDIQDLGAEEYLYSTGVSVIEWSDRMGCLLPEQYLGIELSIKPGTSRILKIKACGKRYRELISNISSCEQS